MWANPLLTTQATTVVPIPAREGSSSMRWQTRALARLTAAMRKFFTVSALYSPEREPADSAKASTTTRLAMLPPTAPPIPSQTQDQMVPSARAPDLAASWFWSRTSPLSVFDTIRNMVFSS